MATFPWQYLLAVAAPVTLSSFVWPVGKTAGASVPQRPPAWVFGVVWPILYVLIALTWSKMPEKWPVLVLVLLLSLWPAAYKKKKVWGVWVISLAIMVSLYIAKVGSPLFIPVLAWLFLAFALNFAEAGTVIYQSAK
jgi:tryptophan-rich sensory protein